jgi:hypothetical protein
MGGRYAKGEREPREESKRRLNLRARQHRESDALQLFAQGLANAEIARRMGCHPDTIPRMVTRALANRAATEGPTVEEARALYLTRMDQLVAAWTPLALGSLRMDDWDMSELTEDQRAVYRRPSKDAAEVLLKVLDRIAAVSGVQNVKPVQPGGNTDSEQHPDSLRAEILATLLAVRDKQRAVEGALAGTTVAIEGTVVETDDKPAPPPVRVPGQAAA